MTTEQGVEVVEAIVGELTYTVRIDAILDFFWTQSRTPDLVCQVCSRPFDEEVGPSIRTVSIDEACYNGAAPIQRIRVHDRHRRCIVEKGNNFLAVSHVWHEVVRDAHESGQSSLAACNQVYNSTFKILQSSRENFGPNTEIWHDYLCVPQWCFEVQQQILLLIPTIYNIPTRIVVHLEDLDPQHVHLIKDFANILDRDIQSLEKMEERYTAVIAFYQCQWMKRVWVTLEFARSRRACLMDSSYKIWKIDGTPVGSFAWISQQCHRNYIMVYNHFPERQGFMQSIRYVSRGQDNQFKGRSLGDTMDELATRECKYHRDRFLAIHASIDLHAYEYNAHDIPRDAAGACRWVWTKAMLRGDYSPLLMQPIGKREKEAFGLSWLVGHEDMNFHTWDFGRPVSPAQRKTIIRDGDIIAPELDYIGTVEAIHPFPIEDGPEAALATLIKIFLSLETWSPGMLIDIIEAVYPIPQFITLLAEADTTGYHKLAISKTDYLKQNPSIEAEIKNCLQSLIDTNVKPSKDTMRQESLGKLISLLELDKQFGPMANDNRLRDLDKRFRQRRGLDPEHSERICSVRCIHCQKVFLTRPDLRSEAVVGVKMYQIPGLSYTMTSSNGVGILVNEKRRIVGRMRQAIRFCECQKSEIVPIS
jgi:hypothetical protein